MRVRRFVVAAALLPFVAAGAALSQVAPTASPTPVGLWQAVEKGTNQPTGWFLISDHGGVFDGIIAKMFLKPGDDPNVVCDQCKDDRHGQPWLGLQIIRGMKPDDGSKYSGGTILDPRDGKIYHATMKVTPDNQTLVVRGYIGFELLGQNQYWSRLPDSAYSMLDPSVNPNPAINPPAPTGKRPPAPAAHKSQLMAPAPVRDAARR